MNLLGSEKLRTASVADYLAGEAVARRKHEYVDGQACMKLPSLQVCILLEQDFPTAVVHRRIESGFRQEILQGLDAVIALPTIDINPCPNPSRNSAAHVILRRTEDVTAAILPGILT